MKVLGTTTLILLFAVLTGCDTSKKEKVLTEAPNSTIEELTSQTVTSSESALKQADFEADRERRLSMLTIVKEHEGLTPVALSGDYVQMNPNNTRIDFLGTKPDGDKHAGGFGHAGGRALFSRELRLTSLEVKITTRSLWADASKLAAHLKNQDFFNVNEYPKSSFKSTSVEDLGEGKYTVTGDLTLLDKTNEISFPVLVGVTETEEERNAVTLTSKFEIDRLSFGMNYGEGKIDKDVKMTVTVGIPAGPSPEDVAPNMEMKKAAEEKKDDPKNDTAAKSDEKADKDQ